MIIADAPVAFSAYTAIAGTSVQYLQVSSAGVTAGLRAGNFFLTAPQSPLLNGQRFKVNFSGWVKAHGSSQYLGVGLYLNPYTSASQPTGNGTLTSATATQSAALTAGTFYDFSFQQEMEGDSNAGTITFYAPTIFIAGVAVSQAANTTPLAVTFASSVQTSPITGINNSVNNPLADFYVAFTNTTSDTVETYQLTEFYVSQG